MATTSLATTPSTDSSTPACCDGDTFVKLLKQLHRDATDYGTKIVELFYQTRRAKEEDKVPEAHLRVADRMVNKAMDLMKGRKGEDWSSSTKGWLAKLGWKKKVDWAIKKLTKVSKN